MDINTSGILNELAATFGANALNVIYAIIWVIVGLIVAKIIGIALRHAFEKLGIEKKIREKKLHGALLGFTVTGIITFLIELAVFIVFLGAAAATLNIAIITEIAFLATVWIGRIGMAATIIIIGLFLGELLSNKVEKSKIAFAHWWSIGIEIFIAYVAVVMALNYLGFDTSLLTYAFTIAIGAVFFSLGLGFAIAIGLGGKTVVRDVLKKRQRDIEKLL